jgi:hypothetical protein
MEMIKRMPPAAAPAITATGGKPSLPPAGGNAGGFTGGGVDGGGGDGGSDGGEVGGDGGGGADRSALVIMSVMQSTVLVALASKPPVIPWPRPSVHAPLTSSR